jgi:hypothetical protein
MKVIHFGGSRYELYDLAKDPGEKVDLSSDEESMKPMQAAFSANMSLLRIIPTKLN